MSLHIGCLVVKIKIMRKKSINKLTIINFATESDTKYFCADCIISVLQWEVLGLTQIVYADVLFVTNMLITYLLLKLVSAVFSVKRIAVRMILASVLGGAFAFYILVPEQHLLITLFIKLSFSTAIILSGFKISSMRQFLKLLLGFYAVSFAFAGIMIAAWILIKPSGMVINNSIVYFNISVPLLVVSSAVCYAGIWIVQRVISKRVPRESVCDVTVALGNSAITCRAMIDTGNSLTDFMTGFPVIIAEYRSVERLLPYEYRAFYSKSGELPQSLDDFSQRVRTIPYEVVGGGGVMPAFKPDFIVLYNGKRRRKIENVIVAVTAKGINQTEYQMLLNSSMSEYY